MAGQERWEPAVTQDEHAPVPPEHLLLIQGTPFVRFAGLLQLAHARGLVALETTVASPENSRNFVRWGSPSLFYETSTLINLSS